MLAARAMMRQETAVAHVRCAVVKGADRDWNLDATRRATRADAS